MFYALGCGTKGEDTDLLTFSSKLVPDGLAYDDDDDTASSALGGSAWKKRKIAAEQVSHTEAREKKLGELSNALVALSSTQNPPPPPNRELLNSPGTLAYLTKPAVQNSKPWPTVTTVSYYIP